MTKREWLAERGLAIPGARGKFSRDANAALKAEEERCAKEGIPLPWTEIVKPESTGRRGRKPKVKIGLTAYEKAQGVTEPENPIVRKIERAEIISPPIRRAETAAWVIDNGTRIALQFCSGCGRSISRCSHELPIAPKWLGGGVAMLERPENVNV